MRNPGVSEGFTDFAAVSRRRGIRLRVAIGLQALQRCSGRLNRRARGSTVATHHFCIRGEITIMLRFERRVCRWESCRMHQFVAALAQLPEALRSERRGRGWKSLTRHHFAHVVQGRDGALKTRPVPVQVRPWAPSACGPTQRHEAQTFDSAGASPATRTKMECPPAKAPGLFAKQCVPAGKWCKSTAFRHSCACSSKRAGGLIPCIALDECRDPERYRTRAPVRPHSSKHRAGAS